MLMEVHTYIYIPRKQEIVYFLSICILLQKDQVKENAGRKSFLRADTTRADLGILWPTNHIRRSLTDQRKFIVYIYYFFAIAAQNTVTLFLVLIISSHNYFILSEMLQCLSSSLVYPVWLGWPYIYSIFIIYDHISAGSCTYSYF